MAIVPHEMWRPLYRACMQNEEDDSQVKQPVVIHLVAARFFQRKTDAMQFGMKLCPFATNELNDLF